MKILFISDNFPPERNAAASRVYERACYWVRWGHKVTVITGAPNFPEGKIYAGYRNSWYQVEYLDGIRVVRVKTFIAANRGVALRILDFVSFMASASAAGLFQSRPEVVVGTSPQFFAGLAACFIARARRLPFVLELADLWPASITAVGAMRPGLALNMVSRLEAFMYGQAQRIVNLTHAFKQELTRRGVAPDKMAVVRNGVDMNRYSPRPRDVTLANQLGLADRFVVGYIGTHGMAHALECVLAAAELLAECPRVRFLFVGAGAARARLVAEAARRGLANVIFVPAQPKEEIQRYWSLCDVALVHLKDTPLFSTVIPSKIFEAMGMGCPILIGAPEGEATDIVRETGSGLVVKPELPVELAQSVRQLLENDAMRRCLATHSRGAAPAFTREIQARDFLAILDEVVRIAAAM